MQKVQVHVASLSLSSIQEDTYLLLLVQHDREMVLPVVLDYGEAQPLLVQLDMGDETFPFTDALLHRVTADCGVRLTEVLIDCFSEGLFEAQVHYMHGDKHLWYPARLSDAVSLALRADCPVYVTAEVMEVAGVEGRVLLHDTDGPAGAGGRTGTGISDDDMQQLLGGVSMLMASENPEAWARNASDEMLSTCLQQAVEQEHFELAQLIHAEQERRSRLSPENEKNNPS